MAFTSGTSFRLGTNFASDRCNARSGSAGFLGGEGCRLTSCTAIDMVGSGFSTGTGTGWTLDRCVATNCAAAGFTGFSASTFTGCVANRCIGGFALTDHNTLSGCVASKSTNGGHGISVTNDCVIRDCVANDNAGSGIVASFSSILGCTTNFNEINGITATYSSVLDCTTNLNGRNGIEVTAACLVRGNTCSVNGRAIVSAGIFVLGSDNRLEDNNCIDNNARGIDVNAAGNIIVRNTCASNAYNWDIVAGNVCGPILSRTAPASAAIVGDSAPDSTGSTHPNANFTY